MKVKQTRDVTSKKFHKYSLETNSIVMITGSGVGMLAFGSPMFAHAIVPPLITISGFDPKKDGFQMTRSANFPT